MNNINEKGLLSGFFLLFGVIFTGLIYLAIKLFPIFNYLNQTWYLPLFIILILLIMFFLISIFAKKIPFFILKLWFTKKRNYSELKKQINEEKTKKDLSIFVNKFKRTINYLVTKNYSENSIDSLINSIGLDINTAKKVIEVVKRYKRLKKAMYLLGLIVSIGIYFIIVNSPFMNYITNRYIPFLVAFVVFLLFILENILITRMPDSFYLKLININQERIIEVNNKLLNQSKVLDTTKTEVKKTLTNLKQIFSHLLSVGVNKSDAIEIMKNYGMSENVAKDFLSSIDVNEIKSLNNNQSVFQNLIKLSLAKVHEDFITLKDLYTQLSVLNNQVTNLEEKQRKLEEIFVQGENNFQKGEQSSSQTSKSKQGEILPFSKAKVLFVPKDDSNKYKEMLDLLYNLLYPYAQGNRKNKFASILISSGYSYEVANDICEMFEKKNVFKIKKPFSEIFVDSINNFYLLISGKK